MRKHLLFVVLAGVMTTACTDDLEPEVTPVGPGTFNDDIPTTGIAVDFNASSNQPEVVDEASAKILSAWTKTTNAGGSNGAMRVHYGINDDMQRALSLYWDAGDKMSIIQVARDKNTGKVLTHNYLLNEVWGSPAASDTPSLRVFMATLRKKIEEDPSHPRYIQTHIGVGYRMIRQ